MDANLCMRCEQEIGQDRAVTRVGEDAVQTRCNGCGMPRRCHPCEVSAAPHRAGEAKGL